MCHCFACRSLFSVAEARIKAAAEAAAKAFAGMAKTVFYDNKGNAAVISKRLM